MFGCESLKSFSQRSVGMVEENGDWANQSTLASAVPIPQKSSLPNDFYANSVIG